MWIDFDFREEPLMFKGGKSSFSRYSICAPKSLNIPTRIFIGRCFIRSLPVNILSPGVMDKKAVRKRMAVPAAPISINGWDKWLSAFIITLVSLLVERWCILKCSLQSALLINNLFEILFDAGKRIV